MRKTGPALIAIGVLTAVAALAQWGRGYGFSNSYVTKARQVGSNSVGTPTWTNRAGFERDVFTFARVRYSSGGSGRGGGWATDLPDSDLNLSYRLQQLTTIATDPDGRVIDLTDPQLTHYPFLYIVEPGRLAFSDAEARTLRDYLLNGGFLMLDDFWGDSAWNNVAREFNRVFPGRSFQELSLDHPIYRTVYQLSVKGQVPGINTALAGQSWENHDGDSRTVHHRVITDDAGRIMVFAAHNTDYGDGWEREGENKSYFEMYSEKYAYPMGINLIFYAMTH